jgi:hypothetical protein
VVICSKCGFRNDDGVEFCANPKGCGAFLAYVGTKAEALSGGVTVAIAPAMIAVKPGEEASCEVRVRNKSNVVDQYDIQVVGEPSRWTIVEPTTLSLFPDAEGVARVRFRPARSSGVAFGSKPFSIAVQSKASPNIAAFQDGSIEVALYQEASLSIVPRTSRGGESVSHRVTVENHGNAPLRATLEASDVDELLNFQFEPLALAVAAGQSAYAQLTVTPRSRFYDGPPQPHPFKVELRADGLAPVAADATMLQEPLPRPIQRKFPLVPVLLGVLLIGVLTGAVIERDPLMQLVAGKSASNQAAPNTGASSKPTPSSSATPTPTPSPTPTPVLATIPNVSCMTAAVAQQAIEGAGFKFAGSFVANPSYANGVVFKTQPVAGQAPLGTEVTAFVSTGPPQGVVPLGCVRIIRILPSGILPRLILPSATPSP